MSYFNKRFIGGILVAVIGIFSAASQITIEDVDFFEAGGNYYSYPWLYAEAPPQTKVPEGYEPFHMEHYGRHGSRWHIGNYNYDKPYELLSKAKRDGKLTPLGEKTYEAVCSIRTEFKKGRDGELSDKGAWQHKGIGRRMAKNYPQIFNPTTRVNARSTNVIRSILSMFNGLNGIQSQVPTIYIETDASNADMYYMNYDDTLAWKAEDKGKEAVYDDFRKKHANKGEYMSKLFNDSQYAKDSIGPELFNPLFSLLVNAQSHSVQPWLVDEIFSIDEARERWLIRNADWFLGSGNSKLTDNLMPFTQSNLLVNIIESADSAMVSPTPSANLRYGHDTIVFPLTCLLEIDGFGEEINDLEELASKGWHDYLVVPMGGNIQMIFYRKPGTLSPEDVLVKVMLNEREVSLPMGRESGPYYKWSDFRDYYKNKINNHYEETRIK